MAGDTEPWPRRLGVPWRDEAHSVALLDDVLTPPQVQVVRARAIAWIDSVRASGPDSWFDVQAVLSAFPISSPAGVNLLRLAEALPRTADAPTQLALLADKLAHIAAALPAATSRASSPATARPFGARSDWFERAAAVAIRLAESLLPPAADAAEGAAHESLAAALANATVRPAIRSTVSALGRQFVFAQTIGPALARAARQQARAARDAGARGCGGLRHSFDMLGEGARSWREADLNLERYQAALAALAAAPRHGNGIGNDSLSVKLSAIHPRFEMAQYPRERKRLLERLVPLCQAAARADLGLSLDAEESERLELQLDLFAELAAQPALRSWPGLGVAIQAYQLRALEALSWAIDLARARRAAGGAPLALRLVKGAYWDQEIKRSQELGLAGYAVFTDKAATDRSYLACATQLLGALDCVFPQFATHNVVTLAALSVLANERQVPTTAFELQRLHGMGEATYRQLARHWGADAPACRIYAPVGDRTRLLPYLVRRLLENGASTSFLRQLADHGIEASVLAEEALSAPAASRIALPPDLYGAARRGAVGFDPCDGATLQRFTAAIRDLRARPCEPVVDADPVAARAVVTRALAAFTNWSALPAEARAQRLEHWAAALEGDIDTLVAICVTEAGKTIPDAIADVREAIDYCRYYASEARRLMSAPLLLPGPTGERNELALAGRGVFACISPWNFPVAILVGQVAAALAAGNTVVAKPAEQTPRAAQHAVRLAHAAGIEPAVLQLLPGAGETAGAALVADPRIAGVAFTGSNATAKAIQRALCEHPEIVPLIAETGGQNAMIVDSTALPEQVVDAVLQSAFRSAGQRCSSLRLLCLQDSIAAPLLEMLQGAMQALVLGDPADPATDVGPVIDAAARAALARHVAAMRAAGRPVFECPLPPPIAGGSGVALGGLMAPTLVELDDFGPLHDEHFGPILHVVRFAPERLDALIDAIDAIGFGLTLGLQTRIDARAQHLRRRARAGNLYVNRNMIGAVVGVQPFGGERRSGTGPKAGGPHYLPRFTTERSFTVNTAAAGGDFALLAGRARR